MLPVVEELADVARLTPWYLFSGAESLSNGIDAILLAIAVVLAVALFGRGHLHARTPRPEGIAA